MASVTDHHKFNDDLLLHASDRTLASKKYESISHVLDHPELRSLFLQYDLPANAAKNKSLRAGILAVVFGFLALWTAAIEIPISQLAGGYSLLHSFDITVEDTLAAAAGLCAVISF